MTNVRSGESRAWKREEGVGAPTITGLSLWQQSMEGGDSLWGLNHRGAPGAT